MGRRLLIAGAAFALLPAAAQACTCDDARSFSPAEVEKAAHYLVGGGFIVVDVERIDKGDLPESQRYAVRRTLLGRDQGSTLSLPADAALMPNGQLLANVRTSCDYALQPGYKGLAVFTTHARPRGPGCSVFANASPSATLRLAGLCTYGLLENPAIIRRAVALSKTQAGVSRSRRPLSSSR